jgi:hypothetical protein
VELLLFCGYLPDFSLYLDLDGDGEPAAHAERFGRNLQNRGRLLALVFRTLDQVDYLLD